MKILFQVKNRIEDIGNILLLIISWYDDNFLQVDAIMN